MLLSESLEEWLSSQVEALQKTFAKVILGFGTLVLPLFLLWSGLSTANKILAYTLWVSTIANLLLIAVVCSYRVARRQRLSDLIVNPNHDDRFSELQHSLMDIMYCYYPERYTLEELEEKSGRNRVDVESALFGLERMTPKMAGAPKWGAQRDGFPNPKGWWLSKTGMAYQEKRRSEPQR